MNFPNVTKVLVCLLTLLMFTTICEAQQRPGTIKIPQERTNDRAPKNGKVKVNKMNPQKAKKQQEANKKKENKEWNEYVKKNRKHALKIQTPEVRERMKNNRKDSNAKIRMKRKKISEGTRKAGKKYN